MKKINTIKKVMLWVFGIAVVSQMSTFALSLMNTADSYVFYLGLLTFTATWVTAIIIAMDEIKQSIK